MVVVWTGLVVVFVVTGFDVVFVLVTSFVVIVVGSFSCGDSNCLRIIRNSNF